MRKIHTSNHQHPAMSCDAITPSDTANLPKCSRRIYVGGAGNISLLLDEDADGAAPRLFTAVPIGTHDWAVKKVMATATTATALVALY